MDKVLLAVLSGTSDRSIRFTDIVSLLQRFGFDVRIKGSHHIFTKDGVEEIINLQPDGDGKAKAYQVKQARNLIIKHKLTREG